MYRSKYILIGIAVLIIFVVWQCYGIATMDLHDTHLEHSR
jgi:hypothetical protein